MTTPADSHQNYPFPLPSNQSAPKLGITDYDALADLFLSDELDSIDEHDQPPHTPLQPSTNAPGSEETSPQRSIEALIVGHLPVRAKLWALQHARAVADESDRTVAVLRCIGETLAIDLLHPATSRRPFSTVDARSLEDALAIAGRCAQHWIILVDELDEPDLLVAPQLDRITILTSADRAAIIAAYQLLKRLHAVQDGALDRARVVIMGADHSAADSAARQLTSVTRTFLSADLQIELGAQRIDAHRAIPLYRGELPEHHAALELIDRAAQSLDTHSQRVERTVRATREPITETKPATEQPSASLCLARYIEGLEALSISCPIEPRVQLAIDADSGIHILTTGDTPDPIRSLAQAGAWASLNRQLILAAAQRTGPESHEPVLHLLVDDVPANRRLLDAPIRVHLLRPISLAGSEPVWFAAPLN